jgi:hypothetical protein
VKRFLLGIGLLTVCAAATAGLAPRASGNNMTIDDLQGIHAGNIRRCVVNGNLFSPCSSTDTCVGKAPAAPDGGNMCANAGANCTKSSSGQFNDRCGVGTTCCSVSGLKLGACAPIFNGTCTESVTFNLTIPGFPKLGIPPITFPRFYFCNCNPGPMPTGNNSQTYKMCD